MEVIITPVIDVVMPYSLLSSKNIDGQYREALLNHKNNSTKPVFSSTKRHFSLYQTAVSLYQTVNFYYQKVG